MKKIITTVFLLLAFTLVACGGEDEAPATGDNGPITLNFEGQDIAFDKTSASVNTGQEVTVNFNNVGSLEHSWVLVSSTIPPEEATDGDALVGATSGTLAGGEEISFTFTAPPPGEYQFVCTVAGHAVAGMYGTFTVN